MKIKRIATAVLVVLMTATAADAQVNLKSLKEKAQNAAKGAVEKVSGTSGTTSSSASTSSAVSGILDKAASKATSLTGKTYYVSSSTGSARAGGLSASSALKDLQKAIDLAQDNDRILVAEGNYLGNMDRGYVESGRFGNATQESDRGKFISLYGGYSADFSERDVIKYVTKLQPTSQKFIAPLMNINARRPYGYTGPMGNVVIDGFVFDLGENNLYCAANVDDERTGTPNTGVLTGRFIEPDGAPAVPKVGYANGDEYGLHLDVEGNVRISNCIFVNCRDYGISAMMGKGHMEICNNIFISCRYASCQVRALSMTLNWIRSLSISTTTPFSSLGREQRLSRTWVRVSVS